MATTQERLRALSKVMRGFKPRQVHWAVFVDELLLRAADEMDAQTRMIYLLADDPILRAMVDALEELERQNRSKEVDAGVPTQQIINLRNAISAYNASRQGNASCTTGKN